MKAGRDQGVRVFIGVCIYQWERIETYSGNLWIQWTCRFWPHQLGLASPKQLWSLLDLLCDLSFQIRWPKKGTSSHCSPTLSLFSLTFCSWHLGISECRFRLWSTNASSPVEPSPKKIRKSSPLKLSWSYAKPKGKATPTKLSKKWIESCKAWVVIVKFKVPEPILSVYNWKNFCRWKLWKYLVYGRGRGQVVVSPYHLIEVFEVNAHWNLSIRLLVGYKVWNPWDRLSDFLYDTKALKTIQFFLQFTLECYGNSSLRMNHWPSTLFDFKLAVTLQISSTLNHIRKVLWELFSSEASLTGVDWHCCVVLWPGPSAAWFCFPGWEWPCHCQQQQTPHGKTWCFWVEYLHSACIKRL